MEWQKSPEALARTFDAALPDDPRLERRKMFGYPCAFVGGNLFAGLHGPDVIIRLPEDARARLLAQPGARTFEPMAGRPMREYVVPPAALVADPPALRALIEESFAFAVELPPKEKAKRSRPPGKDRAIGEDKRRTRGASSRSRS